MRKRSSAMLGTMANKTSVIRYFKKTGVSIKQSKPNFPRKEHFLPPDFTVVTLFLLDLEAFLPTGSLFLKMIVASVLHNQSVVI